jgi:cobalt-precorrin 5A hydrolase
MDGSETMLVIGIGTTSRVTIEDVLHVTVAALDKIEADEQAAADESIYIATLDRPDINPVIVEALRDLEILFLSLEELQGAAPRCVTHSEKSIQRYGVPSVAEAAALAALGPDARLLVPRFSGRNTTASVAYIP